MNQPTVPNLFHLLIEINVPKLFGVHNIREHIACMSEGNLEGYSVSSNGKAHMSLTKTNQTTKDLRPSTRFLFDGIHSTRDRPYTATDSGSVLSRINLKTGRKLNRPIIKMTSKTVRMVTGDKIKFEGVQL